MFEVGAATPVTLDLSLEAARDLLCRLAPPRQMCDDSPSSIHISGDT